MKPSKWSEQEPTKGETHFDFALRMALQRRSNDNAMRERKRELLKGIRPAWAQDIIDEQPRMGRPRIVRTG